MKELFAQLFPSFACSIIMLITVFSFKFIVFFYPFLSSALNSHFIQLALFSAAGFLSYVVAFFFIDRGSTLEVKRMIFNYERT